MSAIYNPREADPASLPIIYGFNNGGSPGYYYGILIAEDGEVLGEHLCSDERRMPRDLGVVQGSGEDHHRLFRQKYPDGYRMRFVPYSEVDGHPGLQEALRRNRDGLHRPPRGPQRRRQAPAARAAQAPGTAPLSEPAYPGQRPAPAARGAGAQGDQEPEVPR